ncbi:LysM peptidoglycan-binding domain-containing protein [Filobacillus milosensis]|uniref:LysM peptidoglycan-binding domain-containing protein n=1 Tax=Filobacillus milosensis TaxID=94137 RepID=A0A4Y8ISW5_9BACI|nr:M14 family zinc carboxypeptidase [Filobacillus milosensis]TFB24023.1 LysM peptidoglycan-binding domain-containing protein [Filobacillus milosensis]
MDLVIQPGMTFYQISNIFNIPLQLIILSNPYKNPNTLRVGEVVNIPGHFLEKYTIQPGDTLWRISQEHQTSLEQIYAINDVDLYQLRIGDTIFIPKRIEEDILTFNELYTFDRFEEDLFKLVTTYPYITLKEIGQSVMNKPIYEVVIGNGDKHVHVNGSFHANESITTSVIMRFLHDYLLSLSANQPIRGVDMKQFFNEITLSLVPMVNPDGVDLLNKGLPENEYYRELVVDINKGRTNFNNWKANIRGVDLNNQYPANWEIEKNRKRQQPSPRDYPGRAPLTEPEAIAMAELVGREDFDRVLALHTQGKVIYWGYEGLEPENAQKIVNEYSRVSGYTPIRYVDSHAGFKDWFIQDYRKPGYTVELGRGTNPLPFSHFNKIYEETLGIFLTN